MMMKIIYNQDVIVMEGYDGWVILVLEECVPLLLIMEASRAKKFFLHGGGQIHFFICGLMMQSPQMVVMFLVVLLFSNFIAHCDGDDDDEVEDDTTDECISPGIFMMMDNAPNDDLATHSLIDGVATEYNLISSWPTTICLLLMLMMICLIELIIVLPTFSKH